MLDLLYVNKILKYLQRTFFSVGGVRRGFSDENCL